jgi:hypothetical protein
VPVGDLEGVVLPEAVELRFTLPPGSYASVLLAELGVEPPLLPRLRAEREAAARRPAPSADEGDPAADKTTPAEDASASAPDEEVAD